MFTLTSAFSLFHFSSIRIFLTRTCIFFPIPQSLLRLLFSLLYYSKLRITRLLKDKERPIVTLAYTRHVHISQEVIPEKHATLSSPAVHNNYFLFLETPLISEPFRVLPNLSRIQLHVKGMPFREPDENLEDTLRFFTLSCTCLYFPLWRVLL